MTDFLRNLAARTLAAPTLRPRGRLRFEPSPEETPLFEVVDSMPDRTSRASQPPDPPAADQIDASFEATRSSAAPAAGRSPVAADDPPPAAATPLLAEQSSWSDRQVPVSWLVHAQDFTGAESPVVSPRPNAADATKSTAATVATVVQRLARQRSDHIVRSAEIETAPRPALHHRYDEQPPRIGATREEITRAETDGTSAGPRASASRRAVSLAVAASSAAEEPIVQVTIGRVEVRASVSNVPRASRSSPATTPMSIDDYIARRKDRR